MQYLAITAVRWHWSLFFHDCGYLYTVSQKKVKIVFGITLLNFHQKTSQNAIG